ncbi:MAG: glycosyltransferase [Candidatus Aminicenantes bacterium]|nr:glycosyltransferase [Candidatus Aminicenantes bacterium]
MKICYFGSFQENYQRNLIIRKGLAENNVEVLECNVPFGLELRFWQRYSRLISKHKNLNKDYDFLLVAEMNHKNIPLAYLISRLYRKPLIFDPFISIYDSNVMDRKRVKPRTFAALKCLLWDKISMKLADLVLADTYQHLSYFNEKLKISEDRMGVLYVGSDDDYFNSNSSDTQPRNGFSVFFYGSFVPLQGIEYIVKAASLLSKEDIQFKILGKGQTYQEIRALEKRLQPANIRFIAPVPLEELPLHIDKSDISLGIFGNTEKTQRVIPTKVYNSLAMGKPVITGDTPAIREVFSDGKNILLCKCANEESLAEAIMQLKKNQELRRKIAAGGHELVSEKFTQKAIGWRLIEILEEFQSK